MSGFINHRNIGGGGRVATFKTFTPNSLVSVNQYSGWIHVEFPLDEDIILGPNKARLGIIHASLTMISISSFQVNTRVQIGSVADLLISHSVYIPATGVNGLSGGNLSFIGFFELGFNGDVYFTKQSQLFTSNNQSLALSTVYFSRR